MLQPFDERRLDCLEAVELIRLADDREHALDRGDFAGSAVGETARQLRLQSRFVRSNVHFYTQMETHSLPGGRVAAQQPGGGFYAIKVEDPTPIAWRSTLP